MRLFAWQLPLVPYIVCVNKEGSGETARKNKFAWTFAVRLYDKNPLHMGWLKWATSWQNHQNGMCAQQKLRSAWAAAQSDQSSLCTQ